MGEKVQTRNSVFAITKESTEGTPVVPTSGGDFLAFHDGFTMEPSFTELTNAELKASIGMAKNVLGVEEPTGSFDHYIRHSGVEGTAPAYSDLMESAFGSVVVNAVEYDTIAGSTTTLIKVNTGEGANFYRGQAILVKNVNGYEIRNVASVSGDDITLAQKLNNAPAISTNLGRAVTFIPIDANHPTLSCWVYRGNKGAVELMSGARVTDVSISAKANENITGSFSLAGTRYYFDAIVITSANKYLDFNDGSVRAISVAEKTYKDPYELADAISVAATAASSDTITVSYDDVTRKFTIATDGATLSLLWNTGANTANTIGTKLGFSVAADDTAALTYTSDNAQSWIAPFTPTYDSATALVAKSNQVMFGLSTEVSCFEASEINFKFTNTKTDILSVCSDSGKSGSQFTAREVTIDIKKSFEVGEAVEFRRYRENMDVVFTYNFGEKTGGNFTAGKCCNIHLPTCRISKFSLTDESGMVFLSMTLQGFVSDGMPEVYFNCI